jgi:endo-1,4-beta-xylanase
MKFVPSISITYPVKMILSYLSLLALTVAGAFASAIDRDLIEREVLEQRQNSFRTQYWANENANLNWTSGSGGNFGLTWNQPNGGNFVVGKGYAPGAVTQVNYKGQFQVSGNSYLALYGWTQNPLVEYYVIESFGNHNPSDNANSTCYGTFQSDGGTYEVWMKWRVNAPSIIGTATFPQFWSVRTTRHVGGTINTTRHFQAYDRAGLKLGRFLDMFIGIEGQAGNGSANITVGAAPTTAVPETATPTIRTERPSRSPTCTPRL